MTVTIQPSQLTGAITAAASKSSMQRACAAALLNSGTSLCHVEDVKRLVTKVDLIEVTQSI